MLFIKHMYAGTMVTFFMLWLIAKIVTVSSVWSVPDRLQRDFAVLPIKS